MTKSIGLILTALLAINPAVSLANGGHRQPPKAPPHEHPQPPHDHEFPDVSGDIADLYNRDRLQTRLIDGQVASINRHEQMINGNLSRSLVNNGLIVAGLGQLADLSGRVDTLDARVDAIDVRLDGFEKTFGTAMTRQNKLAAATSAMHAQPAGLGNEARVVFNYGYAANESALGFGYSQRLKRFKGYASWSLAIASDLDLEEPVGQLSVGFDVR